MTATAEWIVHRTRERPRDPTLRSAALAAEAAGQEWTVYVAVPPPVLGRTSTALACETLVVGDRAAHAARGGAEWGQWDAARELIRLPSGIVVDLVGRRCEER